MSQFLRLLSESDKSHALLMVCTRLRQGETDPRLFEVSPESFDAIPRKPFAYWVSEAVSGMFKGRTPFEGGGRTVRVGLQTSDDFRFLRSYWETPHGKKWFPFAKGGPYSPFYADISLVVNWGDEGNEIRNFIDPKTGKLKSVLRNIDFYFCPGLTWTVFTTKAFGVRVLPKGCVLSHVGGAAMFDNVYNAKKSLLLLSSSAFRFFLDLTQGLADAGRRVYGVGAMEILPFALFPDNSVDKAMKAWSLKRTLDSIEETSHAFLLPAMLRSRIGDFDQQMIEAELANIQNEIDNIALDLYGFSAADRAALSQDLKVEINDISCQDDANEEVEAPADNLSALLSWSAGVAFGRFDWRLATGERKTPPEPDPFDPLPALSPSMLPEGTKPYHTHAGVLVHDKGHPYDLARLIEEVLISVNVTFPDDVSLWLQRNFFTFHLQRYSKSRRKAPIYWPLSTHSSGYTLWVYYPSLTSQTLYIAINDFVEPKLKQVSDELTVLRNKATSRTGDDEKQFEDRQVFELELIELRDTMLKIATTYKPSLDDGVQICASPLWELFQHKPWQKVLKDTWTKLEKGDYDWAHLAMNYWPERVRLKCKNDKSLAIAHGLKELYIEPEGKVKKERNKKNAGVDK